MAAPDLSLLSDADLATEIRRRAALYDDGVQRLNVLRKSVSDAVDAAETRGIHIASKAFLAGGRLQVGDVVLKKVLDL